MKQSKIVLISGASSGIGFETAQYLHQRGFKVIGISRTYPKEAYSFDYYLCDITKEEQVLSIKKTIEEHYGQIDVLINGAGFGISGAIENTSIQDVRKIYDVNVFGHFMMIKAMIDLLRQSHDGRMINISSIASEIALPFQAFYSMTKASLDALTKALYVELKPFSIQVASVLPGDIKTNFTKNRQGPDEIEKDLYFERVKKSLKRMETDEINGMPAIKIAKKIHRLINKKHMPLRVTVGFSYKLIRFLHRVLPDKLVYSIVKKLYG